MHAKNVYITNILLAQFKSNTCLRKIQKILLFCREKLKLNIKKTKYSTIMHAIYSYKNKKNTKIKKLIF